MRLLKNYKKGDLVSYMYDGQEKKGKLKYIFHPTQYEIELGFFRNVSHNDLLYLIETNERDEEGILIDNIVRECNVF